VSAIELRTLAPGDEAALESFLAPRWQSAMFLRANARAHGLVDRGQRLEGTYVAAWRDGAIVSAVAHFCRGLLALAVPEAPLLPSLVQAALAASRRPVRELSGPSDEVAAARLVLGVPDRAPHSREDLFTLALDELRLPPRLADGTWHCRAARRDEHDLLAHWRAVYATHDATSGPEYERVRQAFQLNDVMRVLVVDGELAATCTFNGQLPEVVMVGGVFTPPALRGRHYARAVVAGALREAHAQGVAHALLFTADDNVAARRAYSELGFRLHSDVTLVELE
jgi:predicted GNAT family acetyltransferase